MKEFLCEKNGKLSSIRLVLFLSVIMAVYSTIILRDPIMVGTWLGISGLSKSINRFGEK